jgi:hypothetical protein
MAPIPRTEFARLLRSLPRAERTAFVEALWTERGYEVRAVDASTLVVTDPETGVSRRVSVHRPSRVRRLASASASSLSRTLPGPRRVPPVLTRVVRSLPGVPALNSGHPSGVDVLVTGRDDVSVGGDVTVLGPTDLRDAALYAIDREACASLFDRFFDASPTGWPDPLPDAESAPGVTERGSDATDRASNAALDDRWQRGRTASLLVVVVALAVVLAGTTVGPFGENDARSIDSAAAVGETPSPADGGPVADGGETSPSADSSRAGGSGGYPPGLAPSGIVDANALAAAHAQLADRRSYQVTLVRREYVGNAMVSSGLEMVWVERPSVYVSAVGESGDVRDPTPFIADDSVFANGTTRFARDAEAGEAGVESEVTYDREPVISGAGSPGRYTERIRVYLVWFLTVEESSVVETESDDGTTLYWVTLDGDPWPGVENVSGYALVDSHGFVHEVHRQYTLPEEPNRTVQATIRYDEVGETTVDPPWWFQAALNQTGDAPDEDPARTETSPPPASGDAREERRSSSGRRAEAPR